MLCGYVVGGADLVVVAPPAPVAVLRDVLVEHVVGFDMWRVEGHCILVSAEPLRASMSRASAGVAISSESSSQDADDLRHLLGVARGELALGQVEAVLEPHPNAAAEDRADRDQIGLVASRAEHRPVIVVAEQPVRGCLHVHQVLRIRSDAAEDAEDHLHEQRRPNDPPVQEVRERCRGGRRRSTRIRSASPAAPSVCTTRLDVLEGVAEDVVPRHLQVARLPVVLERLDRVRPSGRSPKFMLPMFSEHSSGLKARAAAVRSSSDMPCPPPVVMLMIASQPRLDLRQEPCEHVGPVGRPPVSGSRAWR